VVRIYRTCGRIGLARVACEAFLATACIP